jgi:ubiquitin C-terminal hydrolase
MTEILEYKASENKSSQAIIILNINGLKRTGNLCFINPAYCLSKSKKKS